MIATDTRGAQKQGTYPITPVACVVAVCITVEVVHAALGAVCSECGVESVTVGGGDDEGEVYL